MKLTVLITKNGQRHFMRDVCGHHLERLENEGWTLLESWLEGQTVSIDHVLERMA